MLISWIECKVKYFEIQPWENWRCKFRLNVILPFDKKISCLVVRVVSIHCSSSEQADAKLAVQAEFCLVKRPCLSSYILVESSG